MNSMSYDSPSNTARQMSTTRPWLKTYHEARRQRTVDLVKATVDHLLADGQAVTLEAIATRSRELDPEGKGIKKAGILGNVEAHAYYRKHSVTYRSGRGQQRRKSKVHVSTQPSRLDPGRDIQRVRQRYLQQSKDNLVERLIAIEQEYAICQNQLARLQFELLDLKLQLEEAKRHEPAHSKGRRTGESS